MRVTGPVQPGEDHGLPPGITVTGGAGGTRAHLADLLLAAAALDLAADRLASAAASADRLSDLVEAASRWSPGTAPAAHTEVSRLTSRWSGVGARAERTRESASAMREVAALYARTDLDVSGFWRRGLATYGAAVGDMGPVGWIAHGAAAVGGALVVAGGVAGLRILRNTPTPASLGLRLLSTERAQAAGGPAGFVARMLGGPGVLPREMGWPGAHTVETLVPGLGGLVIGMPPGRAAPHGDAVVGAAQVLSSAVALAAMAAGRAQGALVVAPVVLTEAERRAATPPRSSADVLRQVEDLYPTAGGAPGTVSVQELSHTDGSRSWVVNVPGTQDWSPLPGTNPMDATTNLQITAGLPQDATRLVTDAMTQAGIAPGEPVLIAGHSQGGIVAMQIAADPLLSRSFTVDAVLTAGAPVGGMALPDRVQALHLEALQDYVGAVDGIPSPGSPHRTTVVSDLWQSPTSCADRLDAASPVTAHDVGVYARTAEALEGSSHPSLQRFDAALDRVLGDDATTVTEHRYVGVRVS